MKSLENRNERDEVLASSSATGVPEGAEEAEASPPLITLAARPFTYDGQSRFLKVSRFARRFIRKMLLVRDNQQQEINMALAMGTEHLARLWNEMQAQLNRLQDALHEIKHNQSAFEGRFDFVNGILAEHEEKLDLMNKASIAQEEKLDLMNKASIAQEEKLDLMNKASIEQGARITESDQIGSERASELRSQIFDLNSQLQAIPYMANPKIFMTKGAENQNKLGYTDDSELNHGYASFEDIFRGPEDFIRLRQVRYLDFINTDGKIIDIGSGRGEFLDVLREAGHTGLGIDNDASMVERASKKGHHVILRDAVTYLKAQASESISTIFSAQFVEHVDYEILRSFIHESFRSLCVGGVLIMETVNPYSIPAFRTFWTDLTHQKPIFPEVLLALTQEGGFSEAQVIFPNGTGDLEVDRWSQGEYAVIARH